VVQKDGDESMLTLLEKTTLDGQSAQLVGLVGKMPAGYKLFPVLAIHSIQFDAEDEEKVKEKVKEKDKDRDER
jgi:hypothetical protein